MDGRKKGKCLCVHCGNKYTWRGSYHTLCQDCVDKGHIPKFQGRCPLCEADQVSEAEHAEKTK